MKVLSIDFETRSACDLKKAGADRYAADDTTDVWCMAWAFDDDPVSIWFHGDTMPPHVLKHIEDGGLVTAWNAAFELAIWRNVILRYHPDWPALKVEQIDDTMARAYASALPGGLDQCAQAVGIALQKDKDGYRLMLKMCQPTKEWRKARDEGADAGPPVWHNNPVDLQKLGIYCMRDVEVERELRKRIDPLSSRELAVWRMDRRINDRGIAVDVLAVEAALRIVDKEKRRLTAELKSITNDQVTSANSVPQMLKWLATKGLEIDNLKKRRVSRLLRSDQYIDPDARRVLEIRLEIAKASTAKLKAMLASRDNDGACRGLFSYHVATTGRWAGRRIQLQNLMRPELEQNEIDECIELFGDEEFGEDIIRISYDKPMAVVASCMRGMIVPRKGNRFIGGDFTGIENRVLMWLAGEDWMIEEFRKFDRGEGVDNYKLTYSRSFGIPIDQVNNKQRLIGKVGALACGFAGSVGAYLGMGDNYDVMPGDVARATRENVSDYVWQETAKRFPKEEQWQFGLDVDTWTGIKIVVDAWRRAHPKVNEFWWDLQDCALNAVDRPGKVQITENGRIKLVASKNFLIMRLPSGRFLHYARPSLKEESFGTADAKGVKNTRPVVKFWGLGKKTKRWEQRTLSPQIMSENASSGTARDVLVDAMLRVERANYPISMHVHDEIVSEVPEDFGSLAEFEQIMCASASWLDGLPVAAKGWVGNRFQK